MIINICVDFTIRALIIFYFGMAEITKQPAHLSRSRRLRSKGFHSKKNQRLG